MSSANRSNYWSTRLGFESKSATTTTTSNSATAAPTAGGGGGGGGGGYYINQPLPLDSYYEKKFSNNNPKVSPGLVNASLTTQSTTSFTPSPVNRDVGGRNNNNQLFPHSSGKETIGGQGGSGGVALPMVRTGTLGPNMKQPGIVVNAGSASFPEPSQLTATNLSSYFSNKHNNGKGGTGNGLDFASAPSSPVSTCSCQSDPDREALMSAILGVATDEALDSFANNNNNNSSSIHSPVSDDNMDIDKILEDDFGGPLEDMSRYGGNQHSRRGSLSTTRTQFGTTAQQPQRRHRTYHRSNCIWNKNNFRNRASNDSKSTADSELEELRRRANLVLKRRQLKESLVKKRNQKMVSRDVDHIDLQMCNRREEEQQEKLRVIEERRAKRLAFKTEVKNQRERKAEETEIEAFFLKKYVQTLQHETEEAARHLERGGGPQGGQGSGQYNDGTSNRNSIISGADISTGFSFAIGADDVDEVGDLSRVPAEDQKSMCNGMLSPKEYERIMGATSLLLALSTQDSAAAASSSSLTTSKSRKSVSMATATSTSTMPSFSASDKEEGEGENVEQDYEDDLDVSFDYNFDFETCTEKTRGAASLLVHKYVSYFRIDIHQTHRDEYKNVRKELTEAQDALQQQENRLGKINNKLRQNVAEYEARLQREEDARTAIEREGQKALKHFEKTLKHERQSFWNDIVVKTINELAQNECEALGELLEEARDSHQACLSRCRGRVFNEYLTEQQRNELEEGVQDAITKTRNKWITARFSLITLSSEKCVDLAHLMLEEAYQAEVAEEHQLRHLHWEMQQAQTINPAASLELNMTPPSSPRAAQIFATEAGSNAAYAAASDTVLKLSSDREIYNTLLMLGIVDNKNHRPNVEMLFGCLNRSSCPTSLSCLVNNSDKGVNGGGGDEQDGSVEGDPTTTLNAMEASRISAAKRRQRLLQQNLSRITLKSMLSQLAEIAVDLLLSDEEADELDTLLEAAGERQRLQVLDDYAAMDVLRKRLKKRA